MPDLRSVVRKVLSAAPGQWKEWLITDLIDAFVTALSESEEAKMQLRRYPALSYWDVEAARTELLSRARDYAPGFVSAYVLGVGWRESEWPALARCLKHLEARLRWGAENADLVLSFVRASTGAPPCMSEGYLYQELHLDTHPELGGDVDWASTIIPACDEEGVWGLHFWASAVPHVGKEVR